MVRKGYTPDQIIKMIWSQFTVRKKPTFQVEFDLLNQKKERLYLIIELEKVQ